MVFLDELLPRHPKIVKAGQLIGGGDDGRLVALGLYVEALTYARNQLTDGIVPAPILDNYPPRTKGKATPATALVRVGLLRRVNVGQYAIHDYHDWNPSASQVKEARRVAREKKAAWRANRKTGNGVSHGDSGGTGQGQARTRDGTIHDPRSTIHDPERETPAPESPTAEALLAHYADAFEAKTGRYPRLSTRDLEVMQTFVDDGTEPLAVCNAIDALFNTGDAYVQRSGYALPLFRSQFNAFLAQAAAQTSNGERQCVHDPPCRSRTEHIGRILEEARHERIED